MSTLETIFPYTPKRKNLPLSGFKLLFSIIKLERSPEPKNQGTVFKNVINPRFILFSFQNALKIRKQAEGNPFSKFIRSQRIRVSSRMVVQLPSRRDISDLGLRPLYHLTRFQYLILRASLGLAVWKI